MPAAQNGRPCGPPAYIGSPSEIRKYHSGTRPPRRPHFTSLHPPGLFNIPRIVGIGDMCAVWEGRARGKMPYAGGVGAVLEEWQRQRSGSGGPFRAAPRTHGSGRVRAGRRFPGWVGAALGRAKAAVGRPVGSPPAGRAPEGQTGASRELIFFLIFCGNQKRKLQ